ncbi:uncharacterized protein LOC128297926 [Anopheles moucheti]|uniref:uncharacterized protein LOC128297926 n=1 Tax=Anopheles moucheti TaxID=186751 RepID=UPI0022F0BD1E|nr:uncharacterized protein LOC128297926 [Anopheles moucheti]
MLLAVALLLSTLVARLDGRFLEISKQPPGTVAIVPNDDDGESVLLGPLFDDLQELDREKASEMISVKLLNQYHAKTFDVAEQLNGNDMMLDDARPLSTELDYEAVNHLQAHGNHFEGPFVHPSSIDTNVIDMKENGIEQDFAPTETILDKRLLEGWIPSESSVVPPSSTVATREIKGNLMAATTATTTTMTTTSTTTRMTTVRKIQRKTRRLQSVSSSSSPRPPSSTQRTPSSRAVTAATTTSTSQRPSVPKIDIKKLNLDHLENDLLSFSTLVPPQALALASVSSSVRLLPRSIKPEEVVPTCGCQHKKRSLSKNLYSSEDPVDDYDYYDDYDYNEVQKRPRSLADRPMLFPAMSRLLAVGSSEVQESSIERAEKVHGTLERLMGIVTIFSHVDDFIQRKTKQSIRRLARLYESEESD